MESSEINRLIEELQTGNDRQRRKASYRLSKINLPEVVPGLIVAIQDSDSSVRQNGIAGLSGNESKEAHEFIDLHPEYFIEPTNKTTPKIFYFGFAFIGWYIVSFVLFWPIVFATRLQDFAYMMIFSVTQVFGFLAANYLFRANQARIAILLGFLLVSVLVFVGFILNQIGCGFPPGLPFPMEAMFSC